MDYKSSSIRVRGGKCCYVVVRRRGRFCPTRCWSLFKLAGYVHYLCSNRHCYSVRCTFLAPSGGPRSGYQGQRWWGSLMPNVLDPRPIWQLKRVGCWPSVTAHKAGCNAVGPVDNAMELQQGTSFMISNQLLSPTDTDLFIFSNLCSRKVLSSRKVSVGQSRIYFPNR